jgi:hypothetical protein
MLATSQAWENLGAVIPPSRVSMAGQRKDPMRQKVLFCPWGQALPVHAGLCASCDWAQRHSLRRFGGHRDEVLARDGCRYQSGGRAAAGCHLPVHHRRPGLHAPAPLITLCAACPARLHRTRSFCRWVPERLVGLWREPHPDAPLPLQLAFEETV